MAPISQYDSRKLRILSFALIVMVVYVHSYYVEAEDYGLAYAVQRFVGRGLCMVAVPMFFLFSGFLFFRGVEGLAPIVAKMRKRVRTLLVPFLLWNVVFLLWFVVLSYTPGVKNYVNTDMLADFLSQSHLRQFYTLFVMPMGFHLWFLRDLILFVALTPLIFWALRLNRYVLPVVLALLSMLSYFFVGFAFFAIGASIALHSSIEAVTAATRPFRREALAVYLSYAVFLPYNAYVEMTSAIGMAAGILFIWHLYDSLVGSRDIAVPRWVGYTFFIYCFHEPTFNIIKKLGLKLLGSHESTLILLYFVNPLLMVAVAVGVAKCLERLVPPFYRLLTGGR